MQEQGNFVAPQVERIDTTLSWYIADGYSHSFVVRAKIGRSLSALSTDLTKENQRGRRRRAKKEEEEGKDSDVLSRCVLQSTKLFLTFRIFYRHDPFDDHAPKERVYRRISRCDSSRKRTKVREGEREGKDEKSDDDARGGNRILYKG